MKDKKTDIIEKYKPNYISRGIDPVLLGGNSSVVEHPIEGQETALPPGIYNLSPEPASRRRPPPLVKNVPYAEPVDTTNMHSASMPNVGNNMEQTWVGLNGDASYVIDDLDQENESIELEYNEAEPNKESIGEYVLIYDGSIISSGNLELVQSEVKDILFGQHNLSKNKNIEVEDLIVLKRVPIKVGVFLGE